MARAEKAEDAETLGIGNREFRIVKNAASGGRRPGGAGIRKLFLVVEFEGSNWLARVLMRTIEAQIWGFVLPTVGSCFLWSVLPQIA
jgi:hypothetical protein